MLTVPRAKTAPHAVAVLRISRGNDRRTRGIPGGFRHFLLQRSDRRRSYLRFRTCSCAYHCDGAQHRRTQRFRRRHRVCGHLSGFALALVARRVQSD